MLKIVSIMLKNFKLIFRSKISALILIFGPLFILLVVALVYSNSSTLRINVGWYSDQPSDLSKYLAYDLRGNNFTVTHFKASLEDCLEEIKAGNIHICIEFPPNMVIQKGRVNEIVFHVDNSKRNLYDSIIRKIDDEYEQIAQSFSENMSREAEESRNKSQEEVMETIPVLNKVVLDTLNQSLRLKNISVNIEDIDLSFDADKVDMDGVHNRAKLIFSSVEDVEDKGISGINQLEDCGEDADSKSDSMLTGFSDNISSSDMAIITAFKAEMEAFKLETEEDTLDYLEDFQRLVNQTRDNANLITPELKKIDDQLEEVEDRFEAARDNRDEELNRLTKVIDDLDESRSSMVVALDSLGLISSTIADAGKADYKTIARPYTSSIEEVVSEKNNFIFMMPFLIIMIIMFITMLLSSTMIVMEKSSTANFRNFVTPTRDFTFLLGAYLTTICMITIQMIILFVFLKVLSVIPWIPYDLSVINDILAGFIANPWPALMIFFASSTLFSFLGMSIGNILNSEETSTLVSIALGSIFLFISDFIQPLENLAADKAELIRTFNPFVISTDILKKSILYPDKFDFAQISDEVYLMLGYALLFFVLMVLVHKLHKKYFMLIFSGYITRKEMKKRMKKIDDHELLLISRNVAKENYFKTIDNKTITSLPMLIDEIEKIDDKTLSHYIKGDENKFADWIMTALKNDKLARKVKNASSKKRLLKILKKGQKEYEKMSERMPDDAKAKKEGQGEKKEEKKAESRADSKAAQKTEHSSEKKDQKPEDQKKADQKSEDQKKKDQKDSRSKDSQKDKKDSKKK
jgi:hypothetical protein